MKSFWLNDKCWHFAASRQDLYEQIKMKTSAKITLLILFLNSLSGQNNPDPVRFTKAIDDFRKEDIAGKRISNLTLFTGSSSIRMWASLKEDFPELNVLNRGFGGSHLSDLLHYFDIVVARHKPETIVIYCGENDLWSGKSPERVYGDFRKLAERIHGILPKTKIHYLACKPSPKRFEKWQIYQACNKLIKDHCAKDRRLNFIDVSQVMLGDGGQPFPEIWKKDKLHMNAAGYKLWTKLLSPILMVKK